MSSDGKIRAFLAIAPPASVLQEIGAIQSRLQHSCPFAIRWLKPASIHVTLKKLGLFPSLHRPRVLWIGLENETAPLATLQRSLEQGWTDCGFPREDRPFRPHLTIGRITSSRLTGEPIKFLAQAGDCSAGSFCADRLTLFQSVLTPQGAVYTQLACFPFGGRSA